MGNWWSSLFYVKERRVLIVGIDAAGKTTLLYQLKLGQVVPSTPTIGFNVETVKYKSVSITAWDIGGRSGSRTLWKHYFIYTAAIVLVVDSNDRARLVQAKEELLQMIAEPELRGLPLLVYANKQDIAGCMNVEEISKELDLASTATQRLWFIQKCSAITAEGLNEGLDWLVANMR